MVSLRSHSPYSDMYLALQAPPRHYQSLRMPPFPILPLNPADTSHVYPHGAVQPHGCIPCLSPCCHLAFHPLLSSLTDAPRAHHQYSLTPLVPFSSALSSLMDFSCSCCHDNTNPLRCFPYLPLWHCQTSRMPPVPVAMVPLSLLDAYHARYHGTNEPRGRLTRSLLRRRQISWTPSG